MEEKKIRCWKFGKWSWKFERCKWCGTSQKSYKTRHKGNGLCIRCFDRKRLENPKRRMVRLKASRKYHKKFRTLHHDWKEILAEKAKQRRLTSKAYKKYITTIGKSKQKYKYFLTKLKKQDKRHDGIEILINGERVKTPIKVNGSSERELERVKSEVEIFQKVYEKYHKKT